MEKVKYKEQKFDSPKKIEKSFNKSNINDEDYFKV